MQGSTTGNNVAATDIFAAAPRESDIVAAGNVMSVVDISLGSHYFLGLPLIWIKSNVYKEIESSLATDRGVVTLGL